MAVVSLRPSDAGAIGATSTLAHSSPWHTCRIRATSSGSCNCYEKEIPTLERNTYAVDCHGAKRRRSMRTSRTWRRVSRNRRCSILDFGFPPQDSFECLTLSLETGPRLTFLRVNCSCTQPKGTLQSSYSETAKSRMTTAGTPEQRPCTGRTSRRRVSSENDISHGESRFSSSLFGGKCCLNIG